MFLKNYWYVSAWSNEIERTPLSRILLNEPVVFFRTLAGTVVALEDRCSHRSYPLHKGRLIGDTIECGYHGLVFDCSGQCIKVPGQAQVPPGAGIRTYPIVERWGLVWIWMGDPALADPATTTDFHWLDDPDWGAKGERLHINCNYKLMIDNLLDLSHLTFVHPRTIGTAANVDKVQITNEIAEDSVTITRWLIDIEPPPTYARAGFKGNIDRWQILNFQPPAFVNLYAGAADTGTGAPQGNRRGGVGLRNINAMTPETERTTHYFWGISQDRNPKDSDATEAIFREIQNTMQEDVEVFEAQQRWLELKPNAPVVNIKSDAGPIAARRIIDRLLANENLGDQRRTA